MSRTLHKTVKTYLSGAREYAQLSQDEWNNLDIDDQLNITGEYTEALEQEGPDSPPPPQLTDEQRARADDLRRKLAERKKNKGANRFSSEPPHKKIRSTEKSEFFDDAGFYLATPLGELRPTENENLMKLSPKIKSAILSLEFIEMKTVWSMVGYNSGNKGSANAIDILDEEGNFLKRKRPVDETKSGFTSYGQFASALSAYFQVLVQGFPQICVNMLSYLEFTRGLQRRLNLDGIIELEKRLRVKLLRLRPLEFDLANLPNATRIELEIANIGAYTAKTDTFGRARGIAGTPQQARGTPNSKKATPTKPKREASSGKTATPDKKRYPYCYKYQEGADACTKDPCPHLHVCELCMKIDGKQLPHSKKDCPNHKTGG